MSISDWISIVTPWVVFVCFFVLLLVYLRSSRDGNDSLAIYAVAFALSAVILALLVSIGHHWLPPKLTTRVAWLIFGGSTIMFGGAAASTQHKFVGRNETLFWIVSLAACPCLVLGLDALLIGLVRWTVVDIALRITDWWLVASPILWFVITLTLAVQALGSRGWRPKDWNDGNLLFKLSAFVSSLLCLALVLDMHLHRPPITDLIFDPPHVWWTFAGSTVFLIIVYWLYRPTMLEEEPDKDRIICSSLLGGFFLPGALNALLIGIYYIIK